jgi:diaminopimelate decarboxylase
MDHFHYKGSRLYCDGADLTRLADSRRTPFYVYSKAAFVGSLEAFQNAFRALKPLVCYSVKSNGNLSLLKILAGRGAGFDIVSGGELYRVRRAGADMRKVVYAGVGKRSDEIEAALRAGILMFNCESVDEMARIDRISRRLGKRAAVAVRVNPDIDPDTHSHITTGTKEKKFGILFGDLLRHLPAIRRLKNLDWRAVHMHIGSQITRVAPFKQSVLRMLRYVAELREKGVAIDTLNVGGGLGVVYDRERPETPADLAAAIVPLVKSRGLKLILEPGRFISANAGALVTTVQYVKYGHEKKFVITDAGMHNLIRPALYDAYHRIVPLAKTGGPKAKADVVGPVCESSDYFAKDRVLPDVREGDRLAVLSAGAYGFAMSSRYNGHPFVEEVLVDGRKTRTIRRPETYADMVKLETGE